MLITHPSYTVSSGTQGWSGGPAGSASITLYGGARKTRSVFGSTSYTPTWGEGEPYGLPTKVVPITASIHRRRMVPMSVDETETLWSEGHWEVVQGLYDYYSKIDPDYTTASYDYYAICFSKDSQNILKGYDFTDDLRGQGSTWVSSSFTMEAWVKPFLTASTTNDFTIAAIRDRFWLGITGSTGMLAFSSSDGGVRTATLGPSERRWNHVALSCDGVSASFYVNLSGAGTFAHTASLAGETSRTLSLGARASASDDLETLNPSLMKGLLRTAFHGMLGEFRLWNAARTLTQISSSHARRLERPLDPNLSLCYDFREGPKGFTINQTLIEFTSGEVFSALGLSSPAGSGTFDRVSSGSSIALKDLYLCSFDDRTAPRWHPDDNVLRTVTKVIHPEPITEMLVVDIPSAFYGRQIATGSLKMVCNAYANKTLPMVRTIVDDGRGNLYISGSVCSSSVAAAESYRGVEWNKVGNVFYSEGLVVIRDPSLLDFGNGTVGSPLVTTNALEVSFRGVSEIPVKTIMCRLEPGEMNASNNPTFYDREEDGHRIKRHASGSVWVSQIGLYDRQKKLVGVVNLAQPIRKRDVDRINFRVRMDF